MFTVTQFIHHLLLHPTPSTPIPQPALLTLFLSCISTCYIFTCLYWLSSVLSLPTLECKIYKSKDIVCFVTTIHATFTPEQSVCVCAKSLQSCPTLCDPMDCSPPGSSVHGVSLGKNIGAGCHALLQGIFPTQGSNSSLLCLLHWQECSLPLAPPGKPAVDVPQILFFSINESEARQCSIFLTFENSQFGSSQSMYIS